MYQVSVAAMSRVTRPDMVPTGKARGADRHSSAVWHVPSMPR